MLRHFALPQLIIRLPLLKHRIRLAMCFKSDRVFEQMLPRNDAYMCQAIESEESATENGKFPAIDQDIVTSAFHGP